MVKAGFTETNKTLQRERERDNSVVCASFFYYVVLLIQQRVTRTKLIHFKFGQVREALCFTSLLFNIS